jgi:hypothetical protein
MKKLFVKTATQFEAIVTNMRKEISRIHKQIQMGRYLWIGILTISFCFSTVFAQKPPTAYLDVEGTKMSFFAKEEVSIEDYHLVLVFLKQEYGEDSEQYTFLIPDTAKFRAFYGFPFFYTGGSSIDSLRKLHQTLPMIAISYEQATTYCQWIEMLLTKRDKSNTWQCSLLEKGDYEKALEKATITQKESLSPLQVKCTESCHKIKDGTMSIIKCRYGNSIYGLTDNVAEYTQSGMIVVGGKNAVLKFVEAKDNENPIGFRCKLTLVSKKEQKVVVAEK